MLKMFITSIRKKIKSIFKSTFNISYTCGAKFRHASYFITNQLMIVAVSYKQHNSKVPTKIKQGGLNRVNELAIYYYFMQVLLALRKTVGT